MCVCFHILFKVVVFPISVKNYIVIFIKVALNLDCFSSMNIFPVLILGIHNHGGIFHFMISSSISIPQYLWVYYEKYCFPHYFISMFAIYLQEVYLFLCVNFVYFDKSIY